MGIMIIPYISSVSEDAMRAVPNGSGTVRALGATAARDRLSKVVVPAAISGVAAAFVLGISRAVGETMVVAIAAGQQPNLTFDPREPAATITAYIVQVALGDLPHGSIGYQTIFAAGLTLLLITLVFNVARLLAPRPVPGGVLMATAALAKPRLPRQTGSSGLNPRRTRAPHARKGLHRLRPALDPGRAVACRHCSSISRLAGLAGA